MPARRPNHKTAHQPCPYGQTNWADCDVAASHRWGMCKALVQQKNRDPEECSNWAVGEEGWCGQHYASKIESERAAARDAEKTLQLKERMAAYFEKRGDTPHVCETGRCPFSHSSPTHVCDPGCPWSPEAVEKGAERRRLAAEAEKLAAGAGLEPATSRVTADRSTTELPRKGPHRIE